MNPLDPQRRIAFTDALRPPPGFVLGAGIGTTFSLDFEAFTAVTLAFVGADMEETQPDAASVLTALARVRARLRVFVNAGGLHPPHLSNRLYALYDRVLRPVALAGAAFHPKVWVLRFEPQQRPELRGAVPLYRVLCSSRNVTDSHCWELGAQFDGKRGKGSAFGADVAKFGKRLARVHQLPPELWRMLNELPVVDFEPGSDAHGDLRFYWQWPDDMELGSRLPKRANRALVISPFVRAGLLRMLCDRAENLTIVSTQAELDALPDEVYGQFREADTYVVTGNGTDDVPALDLHAKLLAWEQGDTRETLVGSANATGAAWGLGGHSNVEAMVSVRPGLRIDDVLRAFVSPEKGRLHGWVERYERAKLEPDEAELARKRLTDMHRQLATIDLRAEYDAKGLVLTLHGRGRPPRPLLTPPLGVDVDVVPLLRADDDAAWRPLRSAYEDGARFDRVGLAELCAFAIVRLRDRSHQCEHRFGIQCDLRLDEADVDRRDAALHGRLLEGIDPRALILNVLRGLPAGSGLFHHGVVGSDGRFSGRSVLQHATFERVMEACTSDPSRIEEVDAILKACGEADGMDSFLTFWEAFKSALREVPRG